MVTMDAPNGYIHWDRKYVHTAVSGIFYNGKSLCARAHCVVETDRKHRATPMRS